MCTKMKLYSDFVQAGCWQKVISLAQSWLCGVCELYIFFPTAVKLCPGFSTRQLKVMASNPEGVLQPTGTTGK